MVRRTRRDPGLASVAMETDRAMVPADGGLRIRAARPEPEKLTLLTTSRPVPKTKQNTVDPGEPWPLESEATRGGNWAPWFDRPAP